jgi:hypothetical protein
MHAMICNVLRNRLTEFCENAAPGRGLQRETVQNHSHLCQGNSPGVVRCVWTRQVWRVLMDDPAATALRRKLRSSRPVNQTNHETG